MLGVLGILLILEIEILISCPCPGRVTRWKVKICIRNRLVRKSTIEVRKLGNWMVRVWRWFGILPLETKKEENGW